MRFLTIGHSNRPYGEFVAALRAHGGDRVADVRTVPRSRAVPWSSGDALEPALRADDIGYRHFPALGGLRKPVVGSRNTAWRNAGFRGYADHMQTEGFRQGVDELVDWAVGGVAALMCAEAVPWRCHRSLLADALLARGHEVVEVFDAGSARPHRYPAFARVVGERVTYPAEASLEDHGAE